ncbi:MAG: hypothetical protein JNL83_39320, partial [Myxococcales bacterium]|nr:hypothetical protein [Myxococcales bacterium]
MAAWRFALVLTLSGAAACGKGSGGSAPPPKPDDGASAAPPLTRVELAARPLGVEQLDAYLYRTRAG